MAFRGLSNIIDLNDDTIDMLGKYKTPEDFITAGNDAIIRYVTPEIVDKLYHDPVLLLERDYEHKQSRKFVTNLM
jgi:hypothetical protein